jgi:hypothetical protein
MEYLLQVLKSELLQKKYLGRSLVQVHLLPVQAMYGMAAHLVEWYQHGANTVHIGGIICCLWSEIHISGV